MKKILLVVFIICSAALIFGGLHESAVQSRAANAAANNELASLTHRLGQTQKANADLQNELVAKRSHLRLSTRHANLTPALLKLLESDFAVGSPDAWAELRRDLNIGWNSSPDYVLVNKRILKSVDYQKFSDAASVTDTTCDLLSLSPTEKSALDAALKQQRDGWQGRTLQRTEPSGDIVAQYTLTQPDAATEQTLSNNFTAGVAASIGPERTDLLLPWGWWEFKNQMGMGQAGTMIIRQTVVDGQPDLVCETQFGKEHYAEPVRYAHYPGGSFLTFFPGGWDELAKRENFQLPPAFHKR